MLGAVGPMSHQWHGPHGGGWRPHDGAHAAHAGYGSGTWWQQPPPSAHGSWPCQNNRGERSRSRRGWSPQGQVLQQYAGAAAGGWRHPYADVQHGSAYGSAYGHAGQQPAVVDCRSEYSSGSDSRGSSEGSSKKSGSCGDEIVHFNWSRGQMLNARYVIEDLLGDGTFGRVCLARDQKENRQVAIKIIRDVKRYMENAKIEADILKDVRKADPHGSSRCAMMYDTFTHESKYFCLVFEPLGTSLYDFLKKNHFRGFWAQDIQVFAKQCLKALKFLHKQLKLTHTDLKPENILLQTMVPPRVSRFPREQAWKEAQRRSSRSNHSVPPYLRPVSADIKIIDFGNATYEKEHHSTVINTRQYRGPEVVMELGWNEKSDIWSVGCIFMELYTAELLFGTHENLEHLALMEKIVGPLPDFMLEGASDEVKMKFMAPKKNGAHGDRGVWRLNWPEGASSPSSESHVASQLPLVRHVQSEHHLLADLVRFLLTHDPRKRPSASEALRHPFLTEPVDD
eukprot:gb/GFBE01055974.1/.p1 GENE.gb/GFBE01055974.1/~~gb/GFBE01055974.1/.p1  ORF type:complete len:510 (+),score=111.59 gb/GFBE01055974.1/:1-1530(+)